MNKDLITNIIDDDDFYIYVGSCLDNYHYDDHYGKDEFFDDLQIALNNHFEKINRKDVKLDLTFEKYNKDRFKDTPNEK